MPARRQRAAPSPSCAPRARPISAAHRRGSARMGIRICPMGCPSGNTYRYRWRARGAHSSASRAASCGVFFVLFACVEAHFAECATAACLHTHTHTREPSRARAATRPQPGAAPSPPDLLRARGIRHLVLRAPGAASLPRAPRPRSARARTATSLRIFAGPDMTAGREC